MFENQAPALDLNGPEPGTSATLNYLEGEPATSVAPEGLVNDVDSPNFDTGTLTVSFQENGTAADQLGIRNQGAGTGEIGVSGSDIIYGGMVVGSFAGGADGAELVITFNGDASQEAVQALTRAISYQNSSDDPETDPRLVSFLLTDGDGGWAEASATVNVTGDGVATIPVVADGTDQSAIINAALANSDSSVLMLPAGEFWIASSIFIPKGKTLVGAGQDLTTVKVLPDFGPLPGWSALVAQSNTRLADLTLDVQKANLGEGSSQRVHGVIGTGTGFLVEDVSVVNTTGYAFWGMSLNPDAPASGVFRDCYAQNGNVLFETTRADGILFEKCQGNDGDGDVPVEAAFHPATQSRNITFRDCYYEGNAPIVNVVADAADQDGILFDNVHGVSDRSIAVFIAPGGPGTFTNDVTFRNSTFVSTRSNGANVYQATVHAENSRFEGVGIGFALLSGTAEMVDSIGLAIAKPSYGGAVFGVYALDPVSWDGGYVSASGVLGSAAYVGETTVSARTSVLQGNLATTAENRGITVDVQGNDSIAASSLPGVTSVGGVAVKAGESVTLASGATVTLNGDGTLSYDPNGSFDSLTDGRSGAANTSGTDQFTYALADGQMAAVRVTLSGVASSGDELCGNAAANAITGTAADDLFMLQQGGNDAAGGLAGNDLVYFGAAFTSFDRVNGGLGTDRLLLQGNYSTGVIPGAIGLLNIETLALLSGQDTRFGDMAGAAYDYKIITREENVTAGTTLIVDAASLRTGEDLNFDGSGETNGRFEIRGGRGADILRGGLGDDDFAYSAPSMLAGDAIRGGGGTDRLILQGAFGAGVAFRAETIEGLEEILLAASQTRAYFGYNLALHDANVAAGQTLLVDGSRLRFGEALMFDGGAEVDGSFRLLGGASNDYIYGGQGSDWITAGSGRDFANGNAGDDAFYANSLAELAGDRLDGGAGADRLVLRGIFQSFAFQADSIKNVEAIVLDAGQGTSYFRYNLAVQNDNVASGETLVVDGSALRFGEALMFNGGAEADGHFTLLGGASNDYLFGGGGDDRIQGGLGRDYLEGNGGADTFAYGSAGESTSTRFDQLAGFDCREDRIDLPWTVSGWTGSLEQGALSAASFDADLATALDGSLETHSAVLFTPDQGDFAGRVFAVIDANGDGSYQAGQDFVIEMVAPVVPVAQVTDFFV